MHILVKGCFNAIVVIVNFLFGHVGTNIWSHGNHTEARVKIYNKKQESRTQLGSGVDKIYNEKFEKISSIGVHDGYTTLCSTAFFYLKNSR